MPDPTRDTDNMTSEDTGTPRWVKVFGLIALVVIVLFVVLLVVGGPGGHGPRRHLSPGQPDDQAPRSDVATGGQEPSSMRSGGRG